jgi:hypothetical protein
MVLDTPEQIEAFKLLQLKGALKLELTGMKMWRGQSAYAIVKNLGGYKGNKQKVYEQFVSDLKASGILKS